MTIGRRTIIGLMGGAALIWPLRSRAAGTPVIGFLSTESPASFASRLAAFRQGLEERGYFDGRNALIEFRWTDGQDDRLPELAAGLIADRVALIVTTGPAGLAAKRATTEIPIVFTVGADPVGLGLVSNLKRPGSNLTGVTNLSEEILPKRLQFLHELSPRSTTIAVLVNEAGPTARSQLADFDAAARAVGVKTLVLNASSDNELDEAFAALSKIPAVALLVTADPFFNSRAERLAALTIRHHLPSIYQFREFVAAGGLAGYGASRSEQFRQMGEYAGRILRGERPGDLPVQQPSKIELFLNMRTANSLGITVPLPLRARADEVIE